MRSECFLRGLDRAGEHEADGWKRVTLLFDLTCLIRTAVSPDVSGDQVDPLHL